LSSFITWSAPVARLLFLFALALRIHSATAQIFVNEFSSSVPFAIYLIMRSSAVIAIAFASVVVPALGASAEWTRRQTAPVSGAFSVKDANTVITAANDVATAAGKLKTFFTNLKRQEQSRAFSVADIGEITKAISGVAGLAEQIKTDVTGHAKRQSTTDAVLLSQLYQLKAVADAQSRQRRRRLTARSLNDLD